MSHFQFYFEMLNLESMRLLAERCSRGRWIKQVKHVGTQLALFSANQHLMKCSETTFLQTRQGFNDGHRIKKGGTNIILHTHTHRMSIHYSIPFYTLQILKCLCCKGYFCNRADVAICLCNCVNTKQTILT